MCHLEPKPIRLCLGEHPTYSMLVVVRMGVFSNTSGSPALGPGDILISSVISEPGHPVAWWALNHVAGAHIEVGQVGGWRMVQHCQKYIRGRSHAHWPAGIIIIMDEDVLLKINSKRSPIWRNPTGWRSVSKILHGLPRILNLVNVVFENLMKCQWIFRHT